MLSIIIPTFNEEKYLPSLLKSIAKQKEENGEIIIADNNSKDDTKKIARSFGCRIVKGGPPAKARNNGAKAAKHDLLFLDADVVLPKHFLYKFLTRIEYENLDYATCRVEPLSHSLDHKFCYMLKNYGNIFSNLIGNPHVSGQCLYIKKSLFKKVKGYDESLYLAEEHELAERLSKNSCGKFFMDMYVYNHPRRLIKDGTYRSLFLDFYSEMYRLFVGKIRHELYKRKYGHY